MALDLRRKLARRGAPGPLPGPATPSPGLLPSPPSASPDGASWPFVETPGQDGPCWSTTTLLGFEDTHGDVALGRVLEVASDTLGLVGLDLALAGVSVGELLFVDTETTGLAGGAGTLPFLLGTARVTPEGVMVTQCLVPAPGEESGALGWLEAQMAGCSAVVSFNGKSFDLPLLNTRGILARRPPLPRRPHLDLLHVARRIFGARLDRCTLGEVERSVLGFCRVDDIAGADIPARYVRFVREGDRGAILPVVQHNRWDLVALAALLGELCARFEGRSPTGRHGPEDAVALAHAALRGGDTQRALDRADDAEARPDATPALRAAAHVVAARAQRQRRDPKATAARLQAALRHCPDDPAVHLQLATLFERTLDDPLQALHHAQAALGAEAPEARARRLQRLERRCRRGIQLRLPGLEG